MMNDFEVVDLSTPFYVGMPKYAAPWFPEFGVSEVLPAAMPEAAWKRRFTKLDLFAHNGTHIETSDHAFRDGVTTCKYDLSRFCGHPYVVDLSDVPDATPISATRITAALDRLRPRPEAILLLRTGYNDRAWGTETFWNRSPYLTAEAAQVITQAKAGFVGLDFQTEKPGEKDFVVHKALLSAGIILCEYLFHLDRIDSDSMFMALPLSIRDVEASPVRAVALKLRRAPAA
ncbi:cyclase family protein [Sorangium sp. So ce429]